MVLIRIFTTNILPSFYIFLVLEHHFQILKLLFYLKTYCSSYQFEVLLYFYGISEEFKKICLKKWLIQVFFILDVSQFYFKQSFWFQVKNIQWTSLLDGTVCVILEFSTQICCCFTNHDFFRFGLSSEQNQIKQFEQIVILNYFGLRKLLNMDGTKRERCSSQLR
ncbi:hypothetical protein TTHERM_000538849 (macronuclear) [Tetrahymena thermophila SB210]|uniref:Uncharacterized protein n=1 Tax=Tetrahymena thermophila (strain SB210) TaxID=312017 RepID=W7XH23_TETTS|nr:hypothetical protein TTHERM_000538849 [Tetrahymena thermophila SB210]EWS76418.1 hypothetical protein TTHERM_000538849 [Tetrahymena thermophila SB210]|eukprot:XP_012651042.1 hypothetical protein TTHERM_000538849 [Tetrahymena thermophila SB210]